MMHVTDQALDRLEVMRDEHSLRPDQGIALVPRDNGEYAFTIATPTPDDQVFERDGKPIVVVPAAVADVVDGLVIDYADTPERSGFTISPMEQ